MRTRVSLTPLLATTLFLVGNMWGGPITTFNSAFIASCIGAFSTIACTTQANSSGAAITNSGTVTTSGETITYTASSVSLPGSLGGSASLSSNTLNSSGPGVMVDAVEQLVDAVTISYAPLNGQTGLIVLDYTLHGTNSATGTDVLATFGSHKVPYACVKLGINSPIFPFGCAAYDQPSLNGTFSTGVFSFIYGQAFPLWFQLESIAGTGFGSGRATGIGTSAANFYNTASIGGLLLYDQNMNELTNAPTITSTLGISYQDVNITPEPSTAAMFIVVGTAYVFPRLYRWATRRTA